MDDSQKVISKDGQVVLSKAVKAGKRIYYLDVRKNRREELFLTITESRKILVDNGRGGEPTPSFEKHKIFLYKEDFDAFVQELQGVVDYVKENNTVDFVPVRKRDDNPSSEGATSASTSPSGTVAGQ